MPNRVVDLLVYWKGRFARHCSDDIWNAISLCIMWTIWKNVIAEHLKDLTELRRI